VEIMPTTLGVRTHMHISKLKN